MPSMTKPEAKMVLTVLALERLCDEGDYDPWRMQELFSPTDSLASDPAVKAVQGSRRWKRGILDRLTERGLIDQKRVGDDGRGIAYAAPDIEALRILLEEEEGVKWLVFPNNYSIPACLGADVEEPTHEAQVVEEDKSDEMTSPSRSLEEDALIALLDRVTMLHGEMIEHRKVTENVLTTLSVQFKALLEAASDIHRISVQFLVSARSITRGLMEVKNSIELGEKIAQLDGRLHFWSRNNEKLARGLAECVAAEKEIQAALELIAEQAERNEDEHSLKERTAGESDGGLQKSEDGSLGEGESSL